MMSHSSISILLWLTGIYFCLGVAVGLVFVCFIPKRFDPDAAAGSRGFRLAILPGIIALWPLILTKLVGASRGMDAAGEAERPVPPERLRRNHGIAFLLLALLGPVLFVVALTWRAPRLEDVPPVDLPPAVARHAPASTAGERPNH